MGKCTITIENVVCKIYQKNKRTNQSGMKYTTWWKH